MAITHNLGFPRIGKFRELKFALEDYWNDRIDQQQLHTTASQLRKTHWQLQSRLDYLPVGDFSFYDQVLDTSFLLGNLPPRLQKLAGEINTENFLDNYFRLARGRASKKDSEAQQIPAAEMTKWFDTNYHYLVPEFHQNSEFQLNISQLKQQIAELQSQGVGIKPVIIGPITYLWLGKSKDDSNKLDLLERILPVYQQLLEELQQMGVQWLQVDEPVLVTELDYSWQQAFYTAYNQLENTAIKILLTTYFGSLQENLHLATNLPVSGIHIDAVNAPQEAEILLQEIKADQVLSVGIVNGRNIWKTDLNSCLQWLAPFAEKLGDRLWLAPSCSLLHVPVDLQSETDFDPEVLPWLAFATQKIDEIKILADALNHGPETVNRELQENANDITSRKTSTRVHQNSVKERIAKIDEKMGKRHSSYSQRSKTQQQRFQLPLFPTTTIGSFPQTADIRKIRRDYKDGRIDFEQYQQLIRKEIKHCVEIQEEIGIDVLVHGEPERNDMVEYFGEQLSGYVFSRYGWVQSYGSRCVKPPIIFGDISRPRAMTIDWIVYAQSLTSKPLKGMLTGPVTILNWSFVRDDQPRSQTCMQLALAIRDEVLDLEQAGIGMIQIDEAALREGLPLRRSEWDDYLQWAIHAFRVTANGVRDETQIHTHMCYSEFNDIIDAIAQMDADVITIETSRSDMELLDVFEKFKYPNEIGPGVYDIHSPNIPKVEDIVALMQKASQRIDKEQLWVNPDCGLKTRNWEEVLPALKNMVTAAQKLREA